MKRVVIWHFILDNMFTTLWLAAPLVVPFSRWWNYNAQPDIEKLCQDQLHIYRFINIRFSKFSLSETLWHIGEYVQLNGRVRNGGKRTHLYS
jgi:hypothetical protein